MSKSEPSWNKTSWSDSELNLLCNPANHNIAFDRYEWRWYHNITGTWNIHSIKFFEDYDKAYSWLKYNIYKWNEELKDRRSKQVEQRKRVEKKIQQICKQQEYDTYMKVLEIRKLKPNLSSSEISMLLDISVQLVRRYVKRAA